MLNVGSRVRVSFPEMLGKVTGTICGRYENPATEQLEWLFCSDTSFPASFDDAPHLGPPHTTRFIQSPVREYVEELNPSKPDVWEKAHLAVGVYATEDFECDDVYFPVGSAGRVLYDEGGARLTVLWTQVRIPQASFVKGPGGFSFKQWEVPKKYLNFGKIDLHSGQVVHPWGPWGVPEIPSPKAKIKYKTGDLVIYTSPRSVRVGTKDGRSSANMIRGTILMVSSADGLCLTGTIVGNCQEQLFGSNLRVDISAVAPFPFTWITEGRQVKVVAEVNFRKRPLKGLTGKVITSTDQDGDVGVQFQEDIGAGSLDGLGQDGKCLYLPVKALEVSE